MSGFTLVHRMNGDNLTAFYPLLVTVKGKAHGWGRVVRAMQILCQVCGYCVPRWKRNLTELVGGVLVNIVTNLRGRWPGFNSRQGQWVFFLLLLFATASRPALGSTQSRIEWVPGLSSPGLKRPGREADYSPPSSAEVKNAWSYTSILQYVFMAWYLVTL